VLVGTLAFQTYAGVLGVELGRRPLITQDADFAQFWGVSQNISESIDSPLKILRGVDETFRQVPHISDPFVSTRYRNGRDYLVDFLTPNRGLPVTVPRPERYAVHKLIVAVDRVNQAKAVKDIEQAAILIDALAARRPTELAEAWKTAWKTGKQWRRKLESGRARLPDEVQETLKSAIKGE